MLGRKLGTRAAEQLFRSDKSRGRLAWAQEQLERRPWVILVSRYVPGGRTAMMFASGTFAMEWRTRFMPFELPLLVSIAVAGGDHRDLGAGLPADRR